MRRFLLALALLLLIAPRLTPHASEPITIQNFVTTVFGMQPVVRLDSNGNALDLHDGKLVEFVDRVDGLTKEYLYGTPYYCGYLWYPSAGHQSCGFAVSKTRDFVDGHWTPQVRLFPVDKTFLALCTQGCFRLHVAYAPTRSSRKYVGVFQTTGVNSGVAVYASDSPDTQDSFTPLSIPILPDNEAAGDLSLFIDTDGSPWLIYHAYLGGYPGVKGDAVKVIRFNDDLTGFVGDAVTIRTGAYEAVDILKRHGVYYAFTGPGCGYCSNSPTLVYTSWSLTGKWSGPSTLTPDSCGGQHASVSMTTIFGGEIPIYMSDLWLPHIHSSNPGFANQAGAALFLAPLTFTGNSIDSVMCNATYQLMGVQDAGPWTLYNNPGAPSDFERWLQTFTTTQAGLHRITYYTFKGPGYDAVTNCAASPSGATCDVPTSDLIIEPVVIDPSTKYPISVLKTCTFSDISYAMQGVTCDVNLDVGEYAFVVRSNTIGNGGFGFGYNDSGAIAGQEFYYTLDYGSTWHEIVGRRNWFTVACIADCI